MSDLNEVGEKDGWRCWLCDAAVDPDGSVNSDLGPSIDSFAAAKSKKGSTIVERLAHRSCNTQRGKIAPVVPWSPELFVIDPAPIVATVENDARAASEWLLDRLSRYAPDTSFTTEAQPGGGQFMLVLRAT